MSEIESAIGINTHVLPGVSLEKAIQAVCEGGFKAFELVPGSYQGVVGYPRIPNAGLWPRTYTKQQRKELRERLACFDTVTIHFPHMEINIASRNPGIREESQRQYFECLELAMDLDIRIATFHCGHHTGSFVGNEDEIFEHNVGFGKRALAFTRGTDMKLGYEAQFSVETMKSYIDAIGDARFGINLDCGDTGSEEFPASGMEGLYRWMDTFEGRIVESHVAGAFAYFNGILDHQPFRRNNVLDYAGIMARYKRQGFRGPFIFEIQCKDVPTVIEDCQEAKRVLIESWEAA